MSTIPFSPVSHSAVGEATEVLHRVRRYIAENFLINDDNLADTQPLVSGGLLDSTGMVELISFIEQEFVLEIADEDLTAENFRSLRDVARFIDGKLKSRPVS